MNKKFGVQLYTLRNFLNSADEIAETFAKIKNMGYDNIQTHCALKNYDDFASLAQKAGLEICGTFDDFEMMLNNPEQSIENHRKLNTKIMGLAIATGYDNMVNVSDFIKKFNNDAESMAPYGFIFAYQIHAHEFAKIEGKTILDHFIDKTDNVSFCLDTNWTQKGGGDIRSYIKKLTGRLDILHLKDYGRNKDTSFFASVGDGNLNWEGIMYEAQCAEVKYFVVEQDDCNGESPFDALARSREYLEKFLSV